MAIALRLISIGSCQRHTIPLVRLERVCDNELMGTVVRMDDGEGGTAQSEYTAAIGKKQIVAAYVL
jgi:hypothetical protein